MVKQYESCVLYPVASSHITHVGWTMGPPRKLCVLFTNSTLYEYEDVESHHYATMTGEEISVGLYLRRNIVGRYRTRKIDTPHIIEVEG